MYTKLAREKVEYTRMRISIARCEFNSCGVVTVAQIARFKSSHEFLVLRYLGKRFYFILTDGRHTEQQSDCASSTAAQADSKGKPAQLVKVAKKVAGDWEELASWLSPDLFSMSKLREIQEDHRRAFSRARAVLDMWSNTFGRKATCRLLIDSLCRMDQRAVAAEVFGSELVDFVQPLRC